MDWEKAIEHILLRMKNELPDSLHYHTLEHTLEVMSSAREIAREEGVAEKDLVLLMTAAAFHDCGFITTYKNHEEVGCDVSRATLPRFGYNSDQIEIICKIIMATRVPQNATTLLEQVLCDADLNYLGTEKYPDISSFLLRELQANGAHLSPEEWLDFQISFLETHQYHTNYCKKNRTFKKQQVLETLRSQRKSNE